ncbi:MAG: tail protein X [Coriobacteriaceae bacterium]|nr:tail protein X [Coriobacteriaceae bacterium]
MSTYTTMQGDTWDAIAYKVYGSCSYVGYLLNANQHYSDIFIFPAGIVLNVPEVEEETVSTLPPWKQEANEEDE